MCRIQDIFVCDFKRMMQPCTWRWVESGTCTDARQVDSTESQVAVNTTPDGRQRVPGPHREQHQHEARHPSLLCVT